jgi:hypothetical protein
MEFFDKILHIQIWKHDEQYSTIIHINCSSMWRFIDIEIHIFGSTLKWYKYTFLRIFLLGVICTSELQMWKMLFKQMDWISWTLKKPKLRPSLMYIVT